MPKIGGKRKKTRTHKEDDEEDIFGKIPKSNLFLKSFYNKERKNKWPMVRHSQRFKRSHVPIHCH
jgi:hypothetical protein